MADIRARETLEDLLGRVWMATGPDRELDHRINHGVRYPESAHMNLELSIRDDWKSTPHYTSSIDDCIALIEEVMTVEWPAFEVHARMVRDRDRWWNYIEITVPSSEFQGRSNHAPLALLEALLCAQIHLAANTRKPVGGEK